MRKLVILFVMLLWTIPAITLASPILNDGYHVPIQYNGNGFEDINKYGLYVNSSDLVIIKPGNNEGIHFNLFNTYMENIHGVTLTPVFNIEYDSGSTTGTWGLANAVNVIDFYVVKAGNNFAVYSVNPEDNYGSWSTYDLWLAGANNGNLLEISHFNAYQASPVPEPATVLLLGSGFVSILLFNRKRKRNV